MAKLRKAKFLQDEEGRFYIRLDGKTILLDESPDSKNLALDQLLMKRSLPGTASPAGKYTVRYLRLLVAEETKDLSIMGHFSALSKDEKRLYVPTNDGLLMVSSVGIQSKVRGGDNVDKVVVEPADGQRLFDFSNVDPTEGLALFEELVVNAQAVVEPAMAWRIAMQSVLFPFIRSAYQDRYVSMHLGSSQSGKSSGARWPSTLLGFDDLRGDYTPAAIRAAGDTGIFFLDNREQRNLSRELQDLLLFAATGGESGRSNPAGGLRKNKARPIISLTSIEGRETAELKNRCVREFFALTKERMKNFSPKDHLQRIQTERHKIMSALMFVLQRFFKIQAETPFGGREPVPDGAARFQDNYRAVCNLLRAFAEVAHKPDAWCAGVIDAWNRNLSAVEVPSERLDFLVRTFIEEKLAAQNAEGFEDSLILTSPAIREHKVDYKETPGRLYVTNYSALLDWGKQRDSHSFPRTSQALSSRLDEIDSPSFRVVRESDAKGVFVCQIHLCLRLAVPRAASRDQHAAVKWCTTQPTAGAGVS